MDRAIILDAHQAQAKHFFRLFLSTAAGGAIGHGLVALFLALRGQVPTGGFLAGAHAGSVGWSFLVFLAVLLGLKFCGDLFVLVARTRTRETQATGRSDHFDSRIESALRKLQEHESERLWKGFRPFVVTKKEFESPDKSVISFYLRPYDDAWLPPFRPGQYLTFRLDHVPGQTKAIVRCYSLSDAYREDYYRISVKRVPPPRDRPELPPGLSSNFFHDLVKEGDVIDVKAPSGHFFLDQETQSGVVLIAGGIGITPMVSMLNTLVKQGRKRDIWLFYGVTNSEQHAMKESIEEVVRNHPHVHLMVCYSQPLAFDVLGRDYQHKGYVAADLLRAKLPSSNFHFYICGPSTMMVSMTEGLRNWGVPDADVHYEAFGPASVPKAKPVAEVVGEKTVVGFTSSNVSLPWTGRDNSVLDLALGNGVEIPSGCKMGNCGSCETVLQSGKVRYPNGKPGYAVEAGKCLPCVCVPDGNIALDA